MTLPLDAGLHLESDDGVWLSSRSDGPRKDHAGLPGVESQVHKFTRVM